MPLSRSSHFHWSKPWVKHHVIINSMAIIAYICMWLAWPWWFAHFTFPLWYPGSNPAVRTIFFLIASGGANCKYHDQLQHQWSKDSLPAYLNVKLVSYSPPLSYFSYFTLKVIWYLFKEALYLIGAPISVLV